jgi:hypothetical protein
VTRTASRPPKGLFILHMLDLVFAISIYDFIYSYLESGRLTYTLGRICSLFYVFIIRCGWYDILLRAVLICRSTSITVFVELLGYFIFGVQIDVLYVLLS